MAIEKEVVLWSYLILLCLQGPCVVVGAIVSDGLWPCRLVVQYKDGQFQYGNRCGDSLMDLVSHDAASEAFNTFYDPLIDSGQLCDGKLRKSRYLLFTLEQQLELLKIQNEKNRPLEHPLLPPYDWLQILAIEAENGFRFPPILRLYMLHISRQQTMSSARSCLLTVNSSGLFQMIFNLEASGEDDPPNEDPSSITSIKLILKGPLAGFVTMKLRGETITTTLFESLLGSYRGDSRCPDSPELSEFSHKVENLVSILQTSQYLTSFCKLIHLPGFVPLFVL